jgi:non-ribosomal peptide synthetase component F
MPGAEKFPQAIVETVENNDVTVMHFVPSMMSVFLEYLRHSEEEVKRLPTLKQIFASGEKLTPSHVQAFNEILHQKNGTRLANLYGPTEATVDVTYFDCTTENDGDFEKIPIGKPIDNIQLFILDESNCMQGIGKTGELCIAGVGVARGYLNRPQLTSEKFDQDFWDYQDKKCSRGDRGACPPVRAALPHG